MTEDFVVHCPKCEAQRHMRFKGSYEHRGDEGNIPSRYSFGHCAVCYMPFVVLQEDYGQGFDDDDSAVIYPANERKLNFSMPPIVRESYDAALGCLMAKQWMPSAVMSGRALEAVCHDQLGSAVMLAKGLNKLLEQGKISQELLAWSNELRFLRNIGAHPTDLRITRDDAHDSMNLLQAILETLYHLRPKFEQMKARRAAAAPPPPSSPPPV